LREHGIFEELREKILTSFRGEERLPRKEDLKSESGLIWKYGWCRGSSTGIVVEGELIFEELRGARSRGRARQRGS